MSNLALSLSLSSIVKNRKTPPTPEQIDELAKSLEVPPGMDPEVFRQTVTSLASQTQDYSGCRAFGFPEPTNFQAYYACGTPVGFNRAQYERLGK